MCTLAYIVIGVIAVFAVYAWMNADPFEESMNDSPHQDDK